MSFAKKVLFPLFSLFLAYQTIGLLQTIYASKESNYSFLVVFIIGFLITLFITGIVAFPGFVFPTNKLLPKSYYEIKNAERLKKIYQILNVPLFKKLLLIFFWGSKRNRKKYFDGSRKGISNLVYQSKQSEFGHFIAFILIVISSIFLLAKSFFITFIVVSIINLIGNVYPVILQRYHRLRIERFSKL